MSDLSKLKALILHRTKKNGTTKLKILLGRVETLWEKDKMLHMSISYFSHNVFERHLFLLKVVNRRSLNPKFLITLGKKTFEHIVGQGGNGGTFSSILSFSHIVFKSFTAQFFFLFFFF